MDGEAFSYNYDLPNDSAYSETCAAISLAFFARRMLELAPKAEYADVMESALYNTTLAGMALDGKSFFYVNPLEVNPYPAIKTAACATSSRCVRSGSAAHAARRTSPASLSRCRNMPTRLPRMAVRCSRTCIWAAWPKLS